MVDDPLRKLFNHRRVSVEPPPLQEQEKHKLAGGEWLIDINRYNSVGIVWGPQELIYIYICIHNIYIYIAQVYAKNGNIWLHTQ